MPWVDVELRIGWTEYLTRYRVPAAQVVAETRDGRRVRFPANSLQRFVTREGVHGVFRIHFDGAGKLVSIETRAALPG